MLYPGSVVPLAMFFLFVLQVQMTQHLFYFCIFCKSLEREDKELFFNRALTQIWNVFFIGSVLIKIQSTNILFGNIKNDCYNLWEHSIVVQGGRSCATASAGALTQEESPSKRAVVAKSVLSRFTRFWMYRFQQFMVMNAGYFMIMMLVQGF